MLVSPEPIHQTTLSFNKFIHLHCFMLVSQLNRIFSSHARCMDRRTEDVDDFKVCLF